MSNIFRGGLAGALALCCIMLSGLIMPASCGREPVKHTVVILGFDSATWDVMETMVERGELPNIKRLMDGGVSGGLETYIPTASPSIWTTIATGKSPEEHGITGFVGKAPGSYETTVVKSTKRRVKALWNIFTEKGIKSAFVGWWATWPAEKVDGVMVSDTFEFKDFKDRVYPPSLTEEMDSLVLPESISYAGRFLGQDVDEVSFDALNRRDHDAAHSLKILSTFYRKDESARRIGLHLLKEGSYEVVGVYFQGLDPVQHYFWRYMQPEYFNTSPELHEKYGGVIEAYYRYYDGIVGEFMESAGDSAVVIVLSDHGMRPMVPELMGDFPTKGLVVEENGGYVIRHINLNRILDILGYLAYEKPGVVDWSKTRAYSWSTDLYDWERMISLNLEGRESDGIVGAHDKSGLLRNIKADLEAIRSARSGKKMFVSVRESGLEGTEMVCRINPDMKPVGGFLIGGKEYGYKEITELTTNISAIHGDGPEGVFVMRGPGVRKGKRVQGQSVYDIAPTVLYDAGLPVARDMDGGVPGGIFEESYMVKRPLKYIDSYETGEKKEPIKTEPASEDEMKERLRSLGYVQ